LTDTLAPRAVVGVLVPWFNGVVEPELAALRPPGVSNQTARFTLDAKVLEDVADAAAKLAACRPDAFLIGLATESFPDGLATLQCGAEEIGRRTERPAFTASHACHAALRALGAKRIGVVTPFDAGANQRVQAAFEASGFEVAGIGGLACPDLASIGRTPLDAIRRVFADVGAAPADAIVQVGTGLPVVGLVDALERALGRPVVACNAAMYWQALRAIGIDDRLRGFGRLLAEH
jgi:maleate isomerase